MSKQKRAKQRRCAVPTGSVPWCWTDYEHAEVWNPVASRSDAIWKARRAMGKSATFWIAPSRRATKDEKEEYAATRLVNEKKVERISPNNPAQP